VKIIGARRGRGAGEQRGGGAEEQRSGVACHALLFSLSPLPLCCRYLVNGTVLLRDKPLLDIEIDGCIVDIRPLNPRVEADEPNILDQECVGLVGDDDLLNSIDEWLLGLEGGCESDLVEQSVNLVAGVASEVEGRGVRRSASPDSLEVDLRGFDPTVDEGIEIPFGDRGLYRAPLNQSELDSDTDAPEIPFDHQSEVLPDLTLGRCQNLELEGLAITIEQTVSVAVLPASRGQELRGLHRVERQRLEIAVERPHTRQHRSY